jgi:iron complex outermembrane receptor protein
MKILQVSRNLLLARPAVAFAKVNTSRSITASIHTFEPQAIVSRSIIWDSIASTADY